MLQAPALEVRNLAKSFGATKALAGVSFTIAAGTAHALLGENGAGKSTTIKLLSGLIRPDEGSIFVDGRAVDFREPRDAHKAGLQTAFQELTLAPDLTVLENMVLAYEPLRRFRLGGIDWRAARRAVARHFEKLELTDIDLRMDVRNLSLNQRQRVEIARALFRNPRILFLDEATSTLSGREIDWLGRIIFSLKQEGATVVAITHKMSEVRQFCDHVTVLRNGRNVGDFAVGDVSDEHLVELIIGRSLDATFPPKGAVSPGGTPLLSVHGLATRGRLSDCSFDLNAGEILGVAGLQGMGQNDLFNTLFGITPATGGKMSLQGQALNPGTPRQAIRAGLAFVPEERKTEGLFLELTGRENISAPVLNRVSSLGVIDRMRELRAVASVMKKVQLAERALFTRAASFSGGNQQKMVIAKWLLTEPRILLLFDPCRGVDVGTKHEIYLMINRFAEAGGAVLLYSSETPELVNLCHRVLVLYDGRVADVLPAAGQPLNEQTIMRATLGKSGPFTENNQAVRAELRP